MEVSKDFQTRKQRMHILVTDHAGVDHRLEALEGWRVMEIIRDWGVGIRAECGGACACATCHVYVDEAWIGRLAPPLSEEIDRLDEAFDVRSNSRLSCQILMRHDLDGLRLRLAPGSEVEGGKVREAA
jgi:ferredoxin, 2Fe-2S